jgi:hypothetical protein
VQSDELGQCIRAWRDRLDPAAAGLAAGAAVDCDILKVQGADLRLIVYSTAPDTPDAEALARLAELVLEGMPG